MLDRRKLVALGMLGGGEQSVFSLPTHYVRKTGNDTTGDGLTPATAWLTIDKAIMSVSSAGGAVISVGAGIYTEQHVAYKYFYPWINFGSLVTIQADAGAVTITDDGSQSVYSTRFAGVSNYKFVNINFADNGAKSAGCVNIGNVNASNISFVNCTITWTPGGAASFGLYCSIASATISNVNLDNVTVVQNGASTGACVSVRFTKTSTGTVSGITIRNCNIVNATTTLVVEGVANFLIDRGTYASTDGYGIRVGIDGVSGVATNGTIQNATISSTNSHGCIIGAGANTVTVSGNTITGGDQGLVLKECQNVTATQNIVSGGSANTFYFKAAVNCIGTYNTISNNVGYLATVAANNVSPFNKCQNITFTHNTLTASGTALLLHWGQAADDAGGGICDYNTYSPASGYGEVRGDADVQTLAELILAWSGYDVANNDTHSTEA